MESLICTYQVWAGIQEHVLSDTQPCPWIPDAWLSCLRATMRSLNIQIKYASWTLPPSRHGDRYLMDDFVNHNLPKHQLERLNACRMHLQVTTLSEIMDNTGCTLLPHILSSPACPTPKGPTLFIMLATLDQNNMLSLLRQLLEHALAHSPRYLARNTHSP